MAQLVNMSISVDAELKAAFLEACRKAECSGADVIRFVTQTVVDASRDPDVFPIRLAACTAGPAPFYARERMHQTACRSGAELLRVTA